MNRVCLVVAVVVTVTLMTIGTFAAGFGRGQRQQLESSWTMQPGLTLRQVLGSGGLIRSTAGLSWPDGRQAVVLYVDSEGDLLRCVDYFDASMSSTGISCYELAE